MFGGVGRTACKGGVFLGSFLILSLPFWLDWAGPRTGAETATAVYSFREAEANPRAFSNWWNYFVAEVVRTNEIVMRRDLSGHPDFQGIFPYLPIPGASARFHQGRIVINNRGYRGDDIVDEDNSYRILTIGDSATFGQSLFPDSRPWSAVLQDMIRDQLRCDLPIQIINGGVNGFHVQNAIDRIEQDFEWLRPRMVISYFGWNSSADLEMTPPSAPRTGPPATGRRVDLIVWQIKEAASTVAGRLGSLVRRMAYGEDQADISLLLREARHSRLYSQYATLVDLAHQRDFRLVFASFNTAVGPDSPEVAFRFYEGPWPDVRNTVARIQVNNLLVQEFASQNENVWFVDTSPGIYGEYNADIFIDVVHFTTHGDIAMATNVFEGILPRLLEDERLNCRPR